MGTPLVVPSLESLLPAIFVAAVADDLVEVTGLRKDMLNGFQVFRVQLDCGTPGHSLRCVQQPPT